MKIFRKFYINGIVMTLSTLLLRWISVNFNSYLTGKIGSEGIGIYNLVLSVFAFGITFATSGISLGTTRIISESLAHGNTYEMKKEIKICLSYALFFSTIAFIALFCGSEYIGTDLLGDKRTVNSLKILSGSLPFIALSSVFNGYFTAVRQVYKSAIGLITEQMFSIVSTLFFLRLFGFSGMESACIAVALGDLISEIISLILNLAMYIFGKYRRMEITGENLTCISKKLLSISLPLAISAYARQGLLTIEHLLIPYGLRRNGASLSKSLSQYGLVHGMAFPVIMFPSCIVYSFAGLLVPEMSEYREKGRRDLIDKAIAKVLKYSLKFSIFVSGALLFYADEISNSFYHSSECAQYIKIFAPLVVVMYLDGAVDGMLKGLNEQLYSMKVNIADALLSVFSVWILIPIFGVYGYVFTVFICEIFNFTLSFVRLLKLGTVEINISENIIKPVLSAVVANKITIFIFLKSNITINSSFILFFKITVSTLLYTAFMRIKIKNTTKQI